MREPNIQPEKPSAPDAGIQANRPTTDPAAAMAQSNFRGRMRRLLEMHSELILNKPKPPFWVAVQSGGLLFGLALGYGAYKEMLGAELDKDLAGVVAFILIFAGAVLPDVLLKLGRKAQYNAARDKVLDFIEKTLRNYPAEVEQVGGVKVLADRVELEALLHVLQDRFPPEESPLPPRKP